MTEPVTVYIGLGANLGFARDTILNSLADLSHLPHSQFIAASSLYRSAPYQAQGPDFINAVAEIVTHLSPQQLLPALLAIEAVYGRMRDAHTPRNAPRTLDLDILLYGQEIITEPALTIPHARLTERAFVLQPLAEIAPHLVIPGKGLITALLAGVKDQIIERL